MSKVSILCSDAAHPVNAWLERWATANGQGHEIEIVRQAADLSGGDLLFLISCHQIIGKPIRDLYRYTLVLHASDLPAGRGWSPLVWAVTEGAEHVVLSLLNAEDALDSGDIWQQRRLSFDGSELYDEINAKLFDAEIELMDWALENIDGAQPRQQSGEPSYFRRRTPADSEIDPHRTLAECFDSLRVADPVRYPAFFHYRGSKYRIQIEKM